MNKSPITNEAILSVDIQRKSMEAIMNNDLREKCAAIRRPHLPAF